MNFIGACLASVLLLSQTESPVAVESPAPVETPRTWEEDKTPPIIQDIAIAARSPEVAPMVSLVVSDDFSGVATVQVYYRAYGAQQFMQQDLVAGEGGIFIGQLPDGLQLLGFEYYIEVKDAAGNGPTQVGTQAIPLAIDPAVESTSERLDRALKNEEPEEIHPAWAFVSLGTGILSLAGAAVVWGDYATRVAPGVAEYKRIGAPPEYLKPAEQLATTEIVVGSMLTVVGAVALGTGIGLLVDTAIQSKKTAE